MNNTEQQARNIKSLDFSEKPRPRKITVKIYKELNSLIQFVINRVPQKNTEKSKRKKINYPTKVLFHPTNYSIESILIPNNHTLVIFLITIIFSSITL